MWYDAVKYRIYARECLRQAEQADTPERRNELTDLARIWTEAAEALDANQATSASSRSREAVG
jgi:hypothetical protein